MTCIQSGQMWQMIHLHLLQNYPAVIYKSADFIILVTLYYLYELACASLPKYPGFSMTEAQFIDTLWFWGFFKKLIN